MSWIDWAILAVAVVVLRAVSLSTRSYLKGVADFLSANRSAGRYLLSIAGFMGATAVSGTVGAFEMHSEAGLPPIWWGLMSIPCGTIILLTGWVFYRFRETRALTMAQFFEVRYSRRFRIFGGFVCWACGILNFGIFPAVAARFFIYFCGLPDFFQIPGIPFHISTFAVVMAVDLGMALTFVNMGGQISVMVTECFQGIITIVVCMVVIAAIMVKFSWPDMAQALQAAAPSADASLLHPYHTSQVGDFSIWFFLIGIFGTFYGYMSWQGTQGFNSSARNPHEQRMGGIISTWRKIPLSLLIILLPLAAITIMHAARFSAEAAAISANLDKISDKTIRNQMFVPVAMAHFLPIGIKGLVAMIMLFFSFTCHDTYMHSWGSIFVQDVVLPLRKRPLSAEQHIRLLRWSIAGVALFAFIFSLTYPQTMKIFFFQIVTGTIWLGGSGAVIVGGLYWKRGTTAGAYAAIISGAILGVAGIFGEQLWQFFFHTSIPFNGNWLYCFAMIAAVIFYVVVSLMTGSRQTDANFEKILHRGQWAVKEDAVQEPGARQSRWLEIIGIRDEFTRADKILTIAMVIWNFGWFAVFLLVTAIHFTFGTSVEWWTKFWHFYILLNLVIGVPATVWFVIGGFRDIRALFKTLKTTVRDDKDDGRVIHEPETSATSPSASASDAP